MGRRHECSGSSLEPSAELSAIPPLNPLWYILSLFFCALQGYLGPGKEQVLKVYYLSGVPGVFCRAFQIQLGHLEPEKISLKGERIFPRIHLDLPRNIKGNTKYEKILEKAKEKLDKGSQRDKTRDKFWGRLRQPSPAQTTWAPCRMLSCRCRWRRC
ncbi:hydrocephalus-inducing protein-like [Strigops habroptila]|uniref:hydrocephalus-inducing protein-like n=1 Tax=Strigops habroptila TaxID=2489341 RepID=UPI0011CF6B3E|nr:hydrocephalus-inducing protein-like [Strigops habroptila]